MFILKRLVVSDFWHKNKANIHNESQLIEMKNETTFYQNFISNILLLTWHFFLSASQFFFLKSLSPLMSVHNTILFSIQYLYCLYLYFLKKRKKKVQSNVMVKWYHQRLSTRAISFFPVLYPCFFLHLLLLHILLRISLEFWYDLIQNKTEMYTNACDGIFLFYSYPSSWLLFFFSVRFKLYFRILNSYIIVDFAFCILLKIKKNRKKYIFIRSWREVAVCFIQ